MIDYLCNKNTSSSFIKKLDDLLDRQAIYLTLFILNLTISNMLN